MARLDPSPNNLGKKPNWRLTTEKIAILPSILDAIDPNQEFKLRQQAALFIEEMAERLNQNIQQQRGKITQNCICVSMIHMHRFFTVHSFRMFDPRDIGAACLFLSGKSEECPRKLEHIVEVWFKMKNRKTEVQPPFNETVKREGAELIVLLESIILQTIGFDLQVDLPHPIVLKNMQTLAMDNHKLAQCAYWFASDIIRLTNWPIRYSIHTIACVCIYITCSWAEYQIPEMAGAPWFKSIDPEMTVELLHKLADEFTRICKECGSSGLALRGMNSQRMQQRSREARAQQHSSMAASSIAQLPPPPPPPNLQIPQKSEPETKVDSDRNASAVRRPIKRSPENATIEEATALKKPPRNEAVSKTQPGDRLPIPQQNQIKQEANSPSSNSNEQEKGEDSANTPAKKKIGLSEYKQRLKVKQEEPADEANGQDARPTSSNASIKTESDLLLQPLASKDNGQTSKRQSFIPDLSNTNNVGVDALTLPAGIPPVEEKKKSEKHNRRNSQSEKEKLKRQDGHAVTEQQRNSSIQRSQQREHGNRSHEQHHHSSKDKQQKHTKHHYRDREYASNGLSSSGTERHQVRENEHRMEAPHKVKQPVQLKSLSQSLEPPPLLPPLPPEVPHDSALSCIPPPPPELEEGELL